MTVPNSELHQPECQMPAIGYAIREQNRPVLDDDSITAAEITFERADDPLRLETFIQDNEFDYVSVHALKLSPAASQPVAKAVSSPLAQVAQNVSHAVPQQKGSNSHTASWQVLS